MYKWMTGEVMGQASTSKVEDGTRFLTTIYARPIHCTCHPSRFAIERTSDFIKVWFWSRSDPNVPADVLNGDSTVVPTNWVSV